MREESGEREGVLSEVCQSPTRCTLVSVTTYFTATFLPCHLTALSSSLHVPFKGA